MDWIQTVIIAIVEGLTEFLPVSSTGHMIITQGALGMESTDFLKAFTVIIQFGAILSVVCLYWRKFFYPEEAKKPGRSWWGAVWRFYLKLIIGVVPAIVLGLAFNDFIESNLGNVMLTAVMLIVGGVFMLFCDRLFSKGTDETPITYRRSLMVGLFQCIAMIPGVSRSMATIVGGMSQRLSRRKAAEFSFFLAVPTMFGATCLELYKLLSDPAKRGILTEGDGLFHLILGSAVAFVVACLAIKFFIGYISRHGFAAFGWYRIVVGLAIIILSLCGIPLTMAD